MEWLGLLASCFVVLSFLMKNVKWIRIINIIGAALWVVYGFTISSMSNILMNSFLIIVHIYYLIKIFQEEKKNG